MNKPIFEYYPQLESTIACKNFAELPTPIEALTLQTPHPRTMHTTQGGELATQNIWIKRDDLSHTEYGGNKVRKLEFILAEAIQANKKRILTFGALGTNHGVATSLFAKKFGLDCEVILFDQPLTTGVLNNLYLMQSLGAKLDYRKSLFKTALRFYLQKQFPNKQTYYLFAGGSNIAGCLGFVNAAFELKIQIDYRLCPEPDYLYCPVGSSATLAGLTLGCTLAGLKTKVIGVRVAPSHLGPIPVCTQKTAQKLMHETYTYLTQRTLATRLENIPNITLNNQYYGDGYGHASKESNAALELFATENIRLDSTYTAKTAAALLRHSKKEPEKRFLYWHTFNSRDTSNLIHAKAGEGLPLAIQQLIAEQ